MTRISDGRRFPVTHPVRIRDVVPHPVSGFHHRPGRLAGVPGGAVAAPAHRHAARPVLFLDEGVRRFVRPGRGVGHRHEFPVRHQLVRAVHRGGQRAGAAAQLRGDDGVFPGGDFPGRDAVRLEPGQPSHAFRRYLHGVFRHPAVEFLDPRGQQLDADAAGLHRGGRRHPRHRLVGGHLQSLVPDAPGAHGAGLFPEHVAGGRRPICCTGAGTTRRASCCAARWCSWPS